MFSNFAFGHLTFQGVLGFGLKVGDIQGHIYIYISATWGIDRECVVGDLWGCEGICLVSSQAF